MSDETKDTSVEQPPQAEGSAPAPKRTSPGEMLREARTARDMSLEGLSGHTMLSRATLQALEDNDFGRMSQPVFVRGYYRKCAKVLDIPEDEIMQAYVAWTGVEGPKAASPRQVDVVPQDVTPGGRTFGLILLILVGAGFLVAAWVLLPGLLSSSTVTQPAASRGSDIAINNPDQTQPETDSAPTPEPAPVQSAPAAQAASPPTDTTEPAPENQQATATPDEDISAVPGPADVPQGLYLKFNQRSWVDIRNASGQRLLGGIVQADTEHTYPADGAPYDVRLGYAPGIDLFVNGQAFNLGEKTGVDNTARFILEIP